MKLYNILYPERILTYTEGIIITKKEYAILKKMAREEKKKITNKICLGPTGSITNNKIIENNLRANEYNNLSILKKEVMIANAILPDDTKIIDLLTVNGFALEHIKTIMRFRGILKNIMLNDEIIPNEKLQEQLNIYRNIINILLNIFKENLNIDNSTIILNRICELLVTSPELFETKDNIKMLKRIK